MSSEALRNEEAQPLNHEQIMALIRSTSFSKETKHPKREKHGFSSRKVVHPLIKEVPKEETPNLRPSEHVAPSAATPLPQADPSLADIAEPLLPEPEPQPSISEEELEALREAAYEEGRAAGIEEGFARGQTNGYEEGKADALATIEEARLVFDAAVRALTAPAETSLGQLNDVVKLAICRLASQRAGRAIDELPAPFVARVDKLAQRLHLGARNVTIRLHPDDLSAIKPHLGTSEILANGNLISDETLHRGDVSVKAGAARINDVMPTHATPPEVRS